VFIEHLFFMPETRIFGRRKAAAAANGVNPEIMGDTPFYLIGATKKPFFKSAKEHYTDNRCTF
jgi:hypothetical protein